MQDRLSSARCATLIRPQTLRVLRSSFASELRELKMPSTKPRLVARITEKQKADFDERAASHQMSSGALLEKLIETFLSTGQPSPSFLASVPVPKEEPADVRRKIYPRLSSAEVEALQRLAQEMGWSKSKYMAQLFRVHLSGEPRFSEREMLELRQATLQLSAMGRNINQVARALNISLDHANQAHAVQWEVMHKVIDLHRKFVKALIKSNLGYWGIGDGDE